MPFRFSLEGVLHFRKSVERGEEIALQRTSHQISSIRAEIRTIEEKQRAFREQRDQDLFHGLHAAHLQEWEDREARLTQAAKSLGEQLQALEIQRQQQYASYERARRDRELLSRLREERHRSYERDQLRKDQKTLDDLFLAQLINSRK